jgi:hypothetical protein
MQTLVIDTNGIVKKLEAKGFSRTQAEGITEALKELDTGSLVTKTDVKQALGEMETRLYKFLAGVLIAHGLHRGAHGRAARIVKLDRLSRMLFFGWGQSHKQWILADNRIVFASWKYFHIFWICRFSWGVEWHLLGDKRSEDQRIFKSSNEKLDIPFLDRFGGLICIAAILMLNVFY